MAKYLYDKDTNKYLGIKFEESDKNQIDELSFVPLADKVLQILTGDPNFSAEDINTDYDEPEQDNWNNIDSENISVNAIDEYSDKVEIIEFQNDMESKIKNTIDSNKSKENVTQSVVTQATTETQEQMIQEKK